MMSFMRPVQSGTFLEDQADVTSMTSRSKFLARSWILIGAMTCLVFLAILADRASVASGQGPDTRVTSADASVMKGYAERVTEYIALQRKMDDGLPKLQPKETTGAIETHQAALAGRIREARSAAKPGDIFGDAAPVFKKIIADDAAQRSTRDTNAALEEVPRKDLLRVNVAYPETQALATVPPLLLERFGPLPDGLEYRFLGRDFVLRDTHANLVVDFIADAVPVWKR
jgi:hypothetical protein